MGAASSSVDAYEAAMISGRAAWELFAMGGALELRLLVPCCVYQLQLVLLLCCCFVFEREPSFAQRAGGGPLAMTCLQCWCAHVVLMLLPPPPTLLLLQTRLQTAARRCLPLQPMALLALLTHAAVPHKQHAAVASPHVAAAAAVASRRVAAVAAALQRASGRTQMPASRQLQRRRTCRRCWRAWPGALQSCCSGWSFRSSNGC